MHQRHLAWLQEQCARPHEGPTIIVTHHAPILEDLGAEGPLAHAYGSDLSGFIKGARPDIWLYGHTHVPVEVTLGETAVRNVSLGYPSQINDEEARGRIKAAALDIPE